MPTIRDIARRAGVSTATVSRVLNNHRAVNESTRYAVLKAAQEIDYPLENLRSKAQIKQSVIVLTREDDRSATGNGQSGMREFERNVWGGVHDVLEMRGIATRLQQSRLTMAEAEQYVNDPSISGLILLGGILDRRFIDYLIANQLPFVAAGSHLQPLTINAVMADIGRGVRLAIDHLIASGRVNIGLVNGPATTMTSEEKLDAYRLSLSLHGLPFIPERVVASAFNAEEGYQHTHRLLAQAPGLDAILYAEDTIAMGGLRALRESGIAVPRDVSVIGFGDYDITRYTDPPIASVHFDMRLMGRIAARRLSMLLDEHDTDPWLVRVPCSLVVRESAP
jgi:DNA-binding LacI/PurR family transcriptional regulator